MNTDNKIKRTVIALVGIPSNNLRHAFVGIPSNKKIFQLALLLIIISTAFNQTLAQSTSEERKLIRDGNKLYKDKKFNDAEIQYRKSLDKNGTSQAGNYNLGDALYKQGKYDEAISRYQNNTNQKLDKDLKAKNWHNLGNAMMKAEKYEDAVGAYKNAMKASPNDPDTRYNLAYAMSKLQQQQQQQQQQKDQNKNDKKDNKEKQDKNQQQQNQDKKDQNKDQQQSQKQQEDKKQEQQKQAQQQKQKISKEDAERILQALKNDEQNLQKKLNKKEGERSGITKNW